MPGLCPKLWLLPQQARPGPVLASGHQEVEPGVPWVTKALIDMCWPTHTRALWPAGAAQRPFGCSLCREGCILQRGCSFVVGSHSSRVENGWGGRPSLERRFAMQAACVRSSSHALHRPEVAPEHTHRVERVGSRAPDPVTAAVPQERAGRGAGARMGRHSCVLRKARESVRGREGAEAHT